VPVSSSLGRIARISYDLKCGIIYGCHLKRSERPDEIADAVIFLIKRQNEAGQNQRVVARHSCGRGAAVTRRLRAMGIRDKPIAPGSPHMAGQNRRVRRVTARASHAYLR
jgi:hypothetical protein